MTTIRGRLALILIGMTVLVWACGAAWTYWNTQSQVERMLDARLAEAGRMINSLVEARGLAVTDDNPAAGAMSQYQRQLACQIWSLDGTLLSRTGEAPDARLSEAQAGFSISTVNGESWRVYTVENAKAGVRIMVGDRTDIRDQLVGRVIEGLLVPALVLLPLMAGLIWLCVRQGLAPLSQTAAALLGRDPADLKPLPLAGLPRELTPVVGALNRLFQRVAAVRERERSFTAFAAHELKTPLAGLKTQAQIALKSGDGASHARALQQIAGGVDSINRLVGQLLDLAGLEASEPRLRQEPLRPLLQAVTAELEPLASRRGISVQLSSDEPQSASFEPECLGLALRNILENAIHHSPEGGSVSCRTVRHPNAIEITVEDEGRGICKTELPHVTDRFFRGRHRPAAGAGLGLSIACAAMERCGGRLILRNRMPQGLAASLVFPAEAT